MLKSFFHTGFVVRDLETSVAFYRDVMGLELKARAERTGEFPEKLLGYQGAHLKVAFLNMGDGHWLELIQYIYPPSAAGHMERKDLGASHLAFHVENIEGFYEEKRTRGLHFISSPAYLYDGGRIVRKALYAQDPDGNWLEFVELL